MEEELEWEAIYDVMKMSESQTVYYGMWKLLCFSSKSVYKGSRPNFVIDLFFETTKEKRFDIFDIDSFLLVFTWTYYFARLLFYC